MEFTVNPPAIEIEISTGAQGPAGTNGVGVPAGGTTGQLLEKVSGTDYHTQWVTLPAYQPLDNDLTAIVALTGAGAVRRTTGGGWAISTLITSFSTAIAGTSFIVGLNPGEGTASYSIYISNLPDFQAGVGIVGPLYAGTIPNPTARVYYLSGAKVIRSHTMTTLYGVQTTAGSLVVSVCVNGTPVAGWTNLTVNSTPQDVALGTPLTVVADDVLTLDVSSVSGSPTDFRFSLPSVLA